MHPGNYFCNDMSQVGREVKLNYSSRMQSGNYFCNDMSQIGR